MLIARNLVKQFARFPNLHLGHGQRYYKNLIDIHPEVRYSLENNQPVVALESTIITHGMPYPQNLETAYEVEEQVRQNGAIPATIAILNGRIKVGLGQQDLEQLANTNSEKLFKCSRRDLPYLIANNCSGGTTVAATMIIANKTGIKIFATGGIGGVHRDGHISMDISADLIELGRTPVAVVCSGVKSILDIPRTLEFLETQGVCVATYGDAQANFPDFYTRDSGCKAVYNFATPQAAAKLMNALHNLNLESGMLIGVPVPQAYAADKELITAAIDEAYQQAATNGVIGKNVTPFLLSAISKITKGASLQANMALIKNNASVAALIACEYCCTKSTKVTNDHPGSPIRTPTIIGGSILDLSMTLINDECLDLNGTTFEVIAEQSAGGVGRNIAEGIYKLYGETNFITAIGADQIGKSLLQLIPQQLQQNVHIDNEKATSMCTVMFDKDGDCKLVLGNMEIHKTITPTMLQQHEKMLSKSPIIVMDANLSIESIECLLKIAQRNMQPVFFEPTDRLIAGKPFRLPHKLTQQIKIISPNIYELKTMAEAITGKSIAWKPNINMTTAALLIKCKEILSLIAHNFDCVLLTLGHHGVILSIHNELENGFYDASTGKYKRSIPNDDQQYKLKFFEAPKVENIVNVSGAGDSFSSGFISAMLKGSDIHQCIAMGFVCAERALQSNSAVPKNYFTDEEQRDNALAYILAKLQHKQL